MKARDLDTAALLRRRILVVEDESFTNSLIVGLLEQSGFEARGVLNAVDAKRSIRSFDPDALVVDIELGSGPSGLELIAALNRSHPHLSFVILSSFRPTSYDIQALSRVTYLSKREASDVDSLLQAVETALTHSELAGVVPQTGLLSALTNNQLEVLKLIAQGYNNTEIAQRRGSSLRAVEQLVARIYLALGLKKDGRSTLRVQATRIYAHEAGLPSEGKAR